MQRIIDEGLAGLLGAEVRGLLADSESLEVWQERLRAASGTIGIWTSGTTGSPQLVQHSADTLLRGIQGGDKHRDDVWGLTYVPGSYAFWQVVLQAVYNRNPIVDLYRFAPAETLARITEKSVTHLSGTPTFFRTLEQAGPPCPSVQAVTTGGEPLDSRALSAIQRQFPAAKIRNVYASTQAGVLLTSDSEVFTIPAHRRGELKVVDGELQVAQSLVGVGVSCSENDTERFYPTGDLVEVVAGDPNSQTMPLSIRFVGRSSSVIHVGGYKVSPERVEAAILGLIPSVKAARVYGQANSVVGEIVACELVMATEEMEFSVADFRQRLSQELPPAAIPRIIVTVDEVELTASGKVKRDHGV